MEEDGIDETKVVEAKVVEAKVDEAKVDTAKIEEEKVDTVKIDKVNIEEAKVDEVYIDELETVENDSMQLENTYATLSEKLYTKQSPAKVPNPQLVLLNDSLGEELGIPTDFLNSEKAVQVFSGNTVMEGTTPIAQAYAGHQFGYFNRLGDGRAILLGEYRAKDGEVVDVQLKGSGRTPYSRGGDGKAALGPMLREYIISEGMHALGIPTTRSLAVVSTGEQVVRDRLEPGAILVRIAKSHIRVGTFQYVARFGSTEELRELADYTIRRHFTWKNDQPYLAFLQEVVKRQAKLIAKWQLVGFIHGVMNTDNMSIAGETIDYGPCAFMDEYDPDTVFSSIDREGRYAYKNQPKIASWNLARFAETLLPLLHEEKEEAIRMAQEEINKFSGLFTEAWYDGMRKKLGLFHEHEMDEHLIEALLSMMLKYKADYTNTFRSLTMGNYCGMEIFESKEFSEWLELWQGRLAHQSESPEEVRKLMENNNPYVIPRNHKVEEALTKAVREQDFNALNSLLQAISKPYDYARNEDEYVVVPKKKKPYVTYCGT